MLKLDILYSILIDKYAIKNNIKKFDILSDIYQINSSLLKHYSAIKRKAQFEKYSNKNNKTTNQLIEIINQLNTEIIIKKMFINVIQAWQFDVVNNVYNMLLKKWNFINIDIFSASNTTEKMDLTKFDNIARINYKFNPEIINGSIVILNSLKVDNSVLGRLNSIEEKLLSSVLYSQLHIS